ncbi:MAG: sugar transferase [Bacteroidales bacterium]|nr:sugar transferase [Bacteroidales bacterium]
MKTPLFSLRYEPSVAKDYTEHGSINGARIDLATVADDEVRYVLEALGKSTLNEGLIWLSKHSSELSDNILVTNLDTCTEDDLTRIAAGRRFKLIVITRPMHTIKDLDEFLALSNNLLNDGGYLYCNSMTSILKKQLILKKWPWGIGYLAFLSHYMWHRVVPKLNLTRNLYYILTGGKNRTFNRVEILGRVSKAGFRVIDEQFRSGHYFVAGQKERKPITGFEPSISPMVRLRRVGKDGKDITIYKFRTMYSYSEYIQPYVYEQQQLKDGGKVRDDYRINFWGRLLRPIWLDELPMLYNLLRGDIKLVGVRPLSHHYFSLYTPEMRELRTKIKPGLMPPFYYEKRIPKTLDEIQASERRYIKAYLRKPFATDWRYFWGIIFNIVFRRRRSS